MLDRPCPFHFPLLPTLLGHCKADTGNVWYALPAVDHSSFLSFGCSSPQYLYAIDSKRVEVLSNYP